jgi:hypothetical protein
MKSMKRVSFLALAALGALLYGAAVGRPATAHAQDDCAISASDVAAIAAIQANPNLDYTDEVTQELAARKQLLSKTITCAKNEAIALQAEVNTVSVAPADQNLQTQLLGQINDAANYYDIELQKLNGSGIRGSELVAQEILTWRASTYTELSSNVDNFVLWSQNQSLFQTASSRMAQITPMVSFLAQANNNDLAAAFSAAQKSFNDAQSENTAARTALFQSLAPDQTLALIKQSLQSLSDTYQKFFDVSTIIQTLLPGSN